jgi:WD40 repeat protein
LTQSRYLADVSRSVLEQDKDPGTAMLLALEALPDKASDDEAQRDRPYWAPAEVSLEASRRLLRERFILKGDAEDVTCVSISPDGTRIASGSYKKARIWNSDGKLLAVLGGHNDSVISVQFSPDASQILTASKNNDKAMLWSADGKLLGELEGHELYLTSAVFSPDGRRVLTASDDKTARVWGADGKPPLTKLSRCGTPTPSRRWDD